MTRNRELSTVQDTMLDFSRRTGLINGVAPERYLWTDAFAACNVLELRRRTGEEQYERLALRLVDQVHHTPNINAVMLATSLAPDSYLSI